MSHRAHINRTVKQLFQVVKVDRQSKCSGTCELLIIRCGPGLIFCAVFYS